VATVFKAGVTQVQSSTDIAFVKPFLYWRLAALLTGSPYMYQKRL
jgi:hypothetical protein